MQFESYERWLKGVGESLEEAQEKATKATKVEEKLENFENEDVVSRS